MALCVTLDFYARASSLFLVTRPEELVSTNSMLHREPYIVLLLLVHTCIISWQSPTSVSSSVEYNEVPCTQMCFYSLVGHTLCLYSVVTTYWPWTL